MPGPSQRPVPIVRRSVTVAAVAALLLAPADARADVVGPAPDKCPSGSVPDACHGGAFCRLNECSGDQSCGSGERCVPVARCVGQIDCAGGWGTGPAYVPTLAGSCEGASACAKGSCKTVKACAPATPATPASPSGRPVLSGRGGACALPGARGEGPGAWIGLTAAMLLVGRRLRRKRPAHHGAR